MVSEKKSSFSKLHWTTKLLIVYLIKNSSLFYFLPKKWWSCDCFFFPASEAPKNFWGPQKRFKFWILDLKVYLKKLGIGPGLYGKSVLYLMSLWYAEYRRKLEKKTRWLANYSGIVIRILVRTIGTWLDLQCMSLWCAEYRRKLSGFTHAYYTTFAHRAALWCNIQ